MDMQIDRELIRNERRRRAWSQQHLAEVSGLGLRTIQRIEQGGAASYESASALAACLELPLSRLERTNQPGIPMQGQAADKRTISRGRAMIGMAASFLAGAALMTMQGVVAEDLQVDLRFADSLSDGAYQVQLLMSTGEPVTVPLPGTRRLVVLPSIIDTPENRAAMPDADPSRWVSPEQLASVIRFLASEEASAVHGAAIPVVGLS